MRKGLSIQLCVSLPGSALSMTILAGVLPQYSAYKMRLPPPSEDLEFASSLSCVAMGSFPFVSPSPTVLPELVNGIFDCAMQLNWAHLSQHRSHVASITTLSYSQNQCFQLTPLTLSHPLSNASTTSSGSGPFSRSTRLLSKCAALLAPIKTASPFSPPSRL